MLHLPEVLMIKIMIKSIFWNVITVARLRKLKQMHKVSLLDLCKPKVGYERLDFVRRKLCFPFAVSNDESKIWVLYDIDYRCDLLTAAHQFMALKVTHTFFCRSFILVFVHALCNLHERKVLWQ